MDTVEVNPVNLPTNGYSGGKLKKNSTFGKRKWTQETRRRIGTATAAESVVKKASFKLAP